MRRYPREAMMKFDGVEYRVNLFEIRRAIVARQVEGQFLGGRQEIAEAAKLSRSTLTRLMLGERTSLPSMLAVLRTLKLKPADILIPVPPDATGGEPAEHAIAEATGSLSPDRGARA